jgi:alpha-N-arabinofuranosidase
VTKPVEICFDEYGVWDETVGLSVNRLRQAHRLLFVMDQVLISVSQTFNLTDALALASWLNVFLQHSSSIEIACLAQSVNLISPLSVSPTGVLHQMLFAPLKPYSDLVRGGEPVRTAVSGAGRYSGETLPRWIGVVSDATLEVLDVSAVLHPAIAGSPNRKLVLAVVSRSETDDIFAEISVAFGSVAPESEAEVHEIWEQDVKAVNDWKDLEHGGREHVHAKMMKEKLQAGK